MNRLRACFRSIGHLRHSSAFATSTLSAYPTPFASTVNRASIQRTMASAIAKRLEGKTILITGASSGIGKSTAKEFARSAPKNLKLILTARRIDTLKEVAAEIKQEVGDGVQVLPVKLDVSNPEEINNFVPSLPEEFKQIDVLVNNALVILSGMSQVARVVLIFFETVAWSRALHRHRRLRLKT